MKSHKFEEAIPCFGSILYKCLSCEAISVDKELAPYSDMTRWLIVSYDCDKAGKQIELLNCKEEKQKLITPELESLFSYEESIDSERFHLWW